MKNKYKILVLSDLKDNTNLILQNAVKLSKAIDAKIQFFHVKRLVDVVATDSQLSAMRSINSEYVATDNKISEVITPICETQNVKIQKSFAFGNVKNEIENMLNTYQPDVVVLGNRKRNMLGFIGDNITDFVIKKHKGAVMNASKFEGFDFDKELSLDFLKNEKAEITV